MVSAPEATMAQPATTPKAPPSKRKLTLRRWLIVTLVVLLLGAAAAVGGWWLGSGRWAYTPAAVGASQQSAETLVREAGLVPQISTEPSDTVAQGTVSSSSPIPGARVLKGTEVRLVVSSGQPVVPDIPSGTAAEAAFQAISAAHLTPAFDPAADQFDKDVSAGAVVSTEPAADTALPISAKVVVVRSKGAPPTVVPAVAGKTLDDARNKLLVGGFTLGPENPLRRRRGRRHGAGHRPRRRETGGDAARRSLVVAASLAVPSVRGESTARRPTICDVPDSPSPSVIRPSTPTSTRARWSAPRRRRGPGSIRPVQRWC